MEIDTEATEEYTNKEFAKDIVKVAANIGASYAIAVGALLTVGYIYQRHLDRKAKKTQNKSV